MLILPGLVESGHRLRRCGRALPTGTQAPHWRRGAGRPYGGARGSASIVLRSIIIPYLVARGSAHGVPSSGENPLILAVQLRASKAMAEQGISAPVAMAISDEREAAGPVQFPRRRRAAPPSGAMAGINGPVLSSKLSHHREIEGFTVRGDEWQTRACTREGRHVGICSSTRRAMPSRPAHASPRIVGLRPAKTGSLGSKRSAQAPRRSRNGLLMRHKPDESPKIHRGGPTEGTDDGPAAVGLGQAGTRGDLRAFLNRGPWT